MGPKPGGFVGAAPAVGRPPWVTVRRRWSAFGWAVDRLFANRADRGHGFEGARDDLRRTRALEV
jgi:hypothetical protein